MPPVTEFWEMPLYDSEGYFHDNPIDRYALNSFMLERGKLHTEDGKLVIYVQHDEPTDPKQRQNWLACAKGRLPLHRAFLRRCHAPDRCELRHAGCGARGLIQQQVSSW